MKVVDANFAARILHHSRVRSIGQNCRRRQAIIPDIRHSLTIIISNFGTRHSLTTKIPWLDLNMSIDATILGSGFPARSTIDSSTPWEIVNDNGSKELYYVNASARTSLPGVARLIFAVAPANETERTTDVVLPYLALKLQVKLLLTLESTLCFANRRAMNESRFVLGRALLQETYAVVDEERSGFAISGSLCTTEASLKKTQC